MAPTHPAWCRSPSSGATIRAAASRRSSGARRRPAPPPVRRRPGGRTRPNGSGKGSGASVAGSMPCSRSQATMAERSAVRPCVQVCTITCSTSSRCGNCDMGSSPWASVAASSTAKTCFHTSQCSVRLRQSPSIAVPGHWPLHCRKKRQPWHPPCSGVCGEVRGSARSRRGRPSRSRCPACWSDRSSSAARCPRGPGPPRRVGVAGLPDAAHSLVPTSEQAPHLGVQIELKALEVPGRGQQRGAARRCSRRRAAPGRARPPRRRPRAGARGPMSGRGGRGRRARPRARQGVPPPRSPGAGSR